MLGRPYMSTDHDQQALGQGRVAGCAGHHRAAVRGRSPVANAGLLAFSVLHALTCIRATTAVRTSYIPVAGLVWFHCCLLASVRVACWDAFSMFALCCLPVTQELSGAWPASGISAPGSKCMMACMRVQVVVHNLPWNCTWQNLKDAFAETTQNIERADVITDNTGRSRCVSTPQ